MEFYDYYIEGGGRDEVVSRYGEMRPFEIDGIVYVPPKVIGGGISVDEDGDWAQSLSMVDIRVDHSNFCTGCDNARRNNRLIVLGKEGE